MNTTSTALCIVVGLLCWTWLRTRSQAHDVTSEAQRLSNEASLLKMRADLARDMADRGYVQVPVIKEHNQEGSTGDSDNEDWEDDSEATYVDQRSWQLAWVPKDQVEVMVMAAVTDTTSDAQDILEAALRPT